MRNYTELRTKDEILLLLNQKNNIYNDSLFPPLFNGTDFSVFELSDNERKMLDDACELLIQRLYDLYNKHSIKPYDVRLDNSRDSYGRSSLAFLFAEKRLNGSGLYAHGSIYLANRVDKALGYTLEAHIYGETGWIANRLYEGALAVGIDLPTDSEFMEALSFIRFRNTQQKRPVVLIYTDIPTEALLQENGCNLKDYGNGLKPKIGKDKQYRLKQGIKIPESQIFYVCKENFQALTEAYREFVNSQNNLA